MLSLLHDTTMNAQGLLVISIGFCLKKIADYEVLTYGALYVFEMPPVHLTVCLLFLLLNTFMCVTECFGAVV
jgi:hypothetical protein